MSARIRAHEILGPSIVRASAQAVSLAALFILLVWGCGVAGAVDAKDREGARPVAKVAHLPAVIHASSATRKARFAQNVVVPASASVGALETISQTLNNCGPASIAAVLAYWHVYRSEAQVAAAMRADNSYWGMSPVHLPVYARSLGMRAVVGYGGTERLVRSLIASGFPVIASQYVSSADPIRHYRPIESYNDRSRTFTSADPYLGAGHVISYSEFSAIWGESDRRFQIIYPPSRQHRLNAVLKAAGWSATRTFKGAIAWERAQMNSIDFSDSGSWIWYNAYADIAFDDAQLGWYRKAETALASARRQGVSATLIAWGQQQIALREHGR